MDRVNRDENQQTVVDRQNADFASAEHGGWRRWPLLILTCALPALAPAAFRAGGFFLYVGFILCCSVVWLIVRRQIPSLRLAHLLLLAIALRLTLFFEPPRLSGDVYRYLWDGSVIAAGLNPYERAPADRSLAFLRRSWHQSINYPGIPTIYPPAGECLFAIAGMLGGTLAAWRALLLILDVVAISVLYRHAGPRNALWYALFPPLLVEGFWSAHVDVGAAVFTLLAVEAIRRGKAGISGAALGIASGIKIIPLAALPALVPAAGRKARFFLALVAAVLIPLLPFAGGTGLMPGFREYATRWIFNSPLYEGMRFTVERAGVTAGLKAAWTSVKDPLHAERLSRLVYAHLYDDFLARALLGLLFAAAVVLILRRPASPETRSARLIGALLLCSPTIHPWYWLPVVPLAIAGGESVWIVLALCSQASYLLYAGASPLLVFALCYAPPLIWQGLARHSAFRALDIRR